MPAPPSCFTVLDPELLAAGRAPAYVSVGEVGLDAKGVGDRLEVALGAAGSLATLRIRDPAGSAACVQLESVVDKQSGASWVTPPAQLADYGPYCVSCPQRVSLGVGGGLYVLPSSDPAPQPATTLQVQPAARDCATGLGLLAGSTRPQRLRLESLSRVPPSASAPGVLALELFISQGSSFFARTDPLPAELQAAVAEANALLAPGLLTLRIARLRRVMLPDPISVERGNHAGLEAVYQTCHDCGADGVQESPGLIPVVLAGCIETRDPIQLRTSNPDGFVARIPDGELGAGRARGVYLRGRDCFAGSEPSPWAPQSLGKLLAHELAHYLGLYHAVEADGSTDTLDDTGPQNVMNYRPFSVGEAGFTTSQLRVMRQHPDVRY